MKINSRPKGPLYQKLLLSAAVIGAVGCGPTYAAEASASAPAADAAALDAEESETTLEDAYKRITADVRAGLRDAPSPDVA